MPETDIILWGATGFVGKLVADYLWHHYGETGEIRFALGGNSRSELEAVHRNLKADNRLPLVTGDAFDTKFLDAMTKKAKVVVSTVGPYAKYGSPLVAACAANGTDYCDLAGEPQWMYKMIHSHQQAAQSSGARVVFACGFDSIPSDLGVLFLQGQARKSFGHPMNRVKLRIKSMRGGLSGGTVATMLNFIDEVRHNPEAAKIAQNPYALTPEREHPDIRQPNVTGCEYDEDIKTWIGPFVMGVINARVVHRSNALMDFAWGKDFIYDEAVMMGDGFKGYIRSFSFAGLLKAFVISSAFPFTRAVMNKTFLPRPGQGPSFEKREKGFFKLLLIGKDSDGNQLRAYIAGDRDPGYGSTCKMLGEAAVCLLKDIPKENLNGGFWTPATAMGEKLITRLIDNAGLMFKILN